MERLKEQSGFLSSAPVSGAVSGNGKIWRSLTATVAVSVFGVAIAVYVFPDWKLIHYPLHAAVESVGAFAAFIVAVLILSLRSHGQLGHAYTWVAAALIGMGFLDGLHALMHAGEHFVWLHSVATLMGGLVFMGVWAADHYASKRWVQYVPRAVLIIAGGIGAGSLLFPEMVPNMVIDGEFGAWARATNIIGGIGFLFASAFFAFQAKRDVDDDSNRMVFSSHCFLFGLSGIIFEFSVIWDAAWWFWHILRLCAYMIAVFFYFGLARNMELRLEQALRSEKRYSAMQQQFVSLVSHEFRTPLAIIDSNAQRCIRSKDEITPEKLKERSEKIRSAVERMIGLIDTTLYASSLDVGKIEMHAQPCNLRKLILETAGRNAEISPSHVFQIDLGGLPESIHCDPKLLEHVFTNLFANAVKYSPSNDLIEIQGATNGDLAQVSVKDFGVGIPKRDLGHMFERYFRAKTAEGIKGTGIGLSVCKEFVEMHGGTIEVDSVEGEGSTFTVSLPIHDEQP